jgi:phospholipid transport system transporter-binding protein
MSQECFQIFEKSPGTFRLRGELSFASALSALSKTTRMFSSSTDVIFDLQEVQRVDSAGVALLLEWQLRAQAVGMRLRYINLPNQLRAIARVTGVDGILATDPA